MTEPAHASNPVADARAKVRRRSRIPRRNPAPAGLLELQQTVGNAAVNALLAGRARLAGALAVQRAPDPLKPFVDQWMKEHVVIGNREFTLIAALPEDQRQAVLAEVRRRYGDEYLRQGQAGTLPGKPPDDKPANPLDAEDYWRKYGKAHLDAALGQTMTTIDFEISGPGLTFDSGERSAFTNFALVGRMQRLDPADVSQLLDTNLAQLVDGVRVLDERGMGADAYEPAVTERIVERLGLGLRRAAGRLSTPYALARAKVVAEARARVKDPGPGPVAEPDADAINQTQPPSGSFGAETTIEHAVAEAMSSGRFVGFDEAQFSMMYVPQLAGEPRPVELDLERGSGDWKIARITKPKDATATDVANALYGTPENAHLVVGRGDRYAFAFPPSGVLAEPYDTIWREHIEQDENGSPLDFLRGRAPSDPLRGLDDETAKLRALDTAANLTADGDQAAVVQRLEIIQSHLAAIATAARPLGAADVVESALARIKERTAACAADRTEAQKWSAHSAGQISVLSEVKTGFDAITQQMFATGLPAVSTPDGSQLVGDVTSAMQGPTVELTNAYAAVVSASDQLDVATTRLATAKERLAAYPFDMTDRLLATIRKRIASLDDNATIPMQSYARARLDALQTQISAQVGELRMAVVNGDGTAANRLNELKSQLSLLDLQSTVGSTISVIHDLEGTLFLSESWKPNREREWKIYWELRAALEPWRTLGSDFDALWQAGTETDEKAIADIRSRVEALRKDTPLPRLIEAAASFQEDEAKRQRLIAIGVIIAGVLAAALTGGYASGAIGGFVGGVVGAGVEAFTFTAITATLSQDQTFGEFMRELTINWATSGGLRVISGAAKLLAGGKLTLVGKAAEDVKLSLTGRAAEMSVEGLWMVAASRAAEEIQGRVSRGEKMTTQTASTIFGHQMLISFASRVLGRGASLLMEGRPGINSLEEVQNYVAKQKEAESIARAFLAKGDDTMGAALVRADTETLRADVAARGRIQEVAADPALAKKYHLELTAGELETLAGGASAATRELTEREISVLMQQVKSYGDHVVAEPAVYAELLAKHRQQGSTVVESLDAGGSPQAKITPQAPDGTLDSPFTLHSRLGEEVEDILDRKNLTPSADVHEYLARRAGDRAAALADLRKVTSQAELDALLTRTLGSEPAARSAPGRPVRSAADRAARAEREAAKKAAKAERYRLEREAHPDWPVVGERPVRPQRATDSFYGWHYSNGNFIDATLSGDGTLTVTVRAKGEPKASGTTLMDAVFKHFGPDRIRRFQAEWVRDSAFTDNYDKYMENLKTMAPKEAAEKTWTGKLMLDRGLTNVTVPDHGPNPARVEPVFSR